MPLAATASRDRAPRRARSVGQPASTPSTDTPGRSPSHPRRLPPAVRRRVSERGGDPSTPPSHARAPPGPATARRRSRPPAKAARGHGAEPSRRIATPFVRCRRMRNHGHFPPTFQRRARLNTAMILSAPGSRRQAIGRRTLPGQSSGHIPPLSGGDVSRQRQTGKDKSCHTPGRRSMVRASETLRATEWPQCLPCGGAVPYNMNHPV